MNKKQPSKQQPKARANRRASVQALTDEQLKQVTGGLNPQPLPPGRYEPPSPCDQ